MTSYKHDWRDKEYPAIKKEYYECEICGQRDFNPMPIEMEIRPCILKTRKSEFNAIIKEGGQYG